MRTATIYSRATCGISAPLVNVEAHISSGLPGFCIVGLPETAIRESRERVRSAIINTGYDFPAKKIIINLAPADLPKQGSNFDLPIALGILAATSQISNEVLYKYEFAGELALTGDLRAINNALSIAFATRISERTLILPLKNKHCFLPKDKIIYLADNLTQVCKFLNNKNTLHTYTNYFCVQKNLSDLTQVEKQLINENVNKSNNENFTQSKDSLNNFDESKPIDFDDIYGQTHAKRALTIAASGKHNMLMIGPPGTGKTMLASRIITILPELNYEDALEIALIHSLNKSSSSKIFNFRPFRAPHHTISKVALVGGGNIPFPGEITLAHKGVLFLDELLEFDKKVLETLREPMESKEILISRSKYSVLYPANFQLIAAANPCPCGNYGAKNKECYCSTEIIKKYCARASTPLVDRIDIKLFVSHLSPMECMNNKKTNDEYSSSNLKKAVNTARALQIKRAGKLNSELSNDEIQKYCQLNIDCTKVLEKAIEKHNLSVRSCNKIIKIARTIADLEQATNIEKNHLSQALGFNICGKFFR